MLIIALPAQADMKLEPGTSIIFYHHDLLGNPVMASDHKGRVLWYENTQPYGESTGKVSSSGIRHSDNLFGEAVTELGYTGHAVDRNTNLVYMKARHYDPVIGRFYSNDPVGYGISNPMSFNRYAYANNNPYLYNDPNGQFPLLVVPASIVVGEWALGALAGTAIGVGLYEFGSSILNNELEDGSGEFGIPDEWTKDQIDSSPKNVPISELDPLHPRDTVGKRPDLKKLTDEELLRAARKPRDPGTEMKVNERGKLIDGNSRAYELIDRSDDPSSSITPDTTVPVEKQESSWGDLFSWD